MKKVTSKELPSSQKKKNARSFDAVSYEALQELVKPHINSFDYFHQRGLAKAVSLITPVEVDQRSTGTTLRMWLERPSIQPPMKDSANPMLLPTECRQAFLSYTGLFTAELHIDLNGSVTSKQQVSFGKIPVMVKSSICHLRGLSPQKLVAVKEEATEMGGYFITKGIERIIRLLILPKRNHIIAIQRGAFQNRGTGFSDMGLIMWCVRPDETGSTLKLYYLLHGTARLGFTYVVTSAQ